jgi:hypothetical protein
MIDFQNASYIKLGQVHVNEVADQIRPLLLEGEELYAAFKGMRDYIAFTSKRIIAVNVQGITGKKKDFTSLPFSKVQAFSLETAGTFDLDAELELWFSGLGKVKFEFKGRTDVAYLNKLIAHYVL